MTGALDRLAAARGEPGSPERTLREWDLDLIHLSADEIAAEWRDLVPLTAPPLVLAGPSTEERKRLAREGKAMSGGEYPIPNITYLKKAIQAFGRAKNKDATKRWIRKRARELNATNLLPESWSEGSS